jgi:hypothetical protein
MVVTGLGETGYQNTILRRWQESVSAGSGSICQNLNHKGHEGTQRKSLQPLCGSGFYLAVTKLSHYLKCWQRSILREKRRAETTKDTKGHKGKPPTWLLRASMATRMEKGEEIPWDTGRLLLTRYSFRGKLRSIDQPHRWHQYCVGVVPWPTVRFRDLMLSILWGRVPHWTRRSPGRNG